MRGKQRVAGAKRFAAAASDVYASLLLTVFFLAVPRGGYRVIADFKFTLFLVLSLGYLAAMAGCGLAALAGGARVSLRWALAPVNAAALAYLALSAVSAILSPYGAETLLGGTRHNGLLTVTLYVIPFLLLSRWLVPRERHLWLLALSAVLCCTLAAMQIAGANPLGLYPAGMDFFGADVQYDGMYIGTFGNADMAAAVLCGAFAAFLMAVLRRKKDVELLFFVPLVLLLFVLVRMGVASAAVALACAALLAAPVAAGKRKRARRAAFIVLAAVPAAVLLLLWFGRFESGVLYEASALLHGRGEPQFGSGRLSVWRAALAASREHLLFGTGPDTFRFLGLKFQSAAADGAVRDIAVTAAHNDYLNILVEQGLLALAAWLLLLGLLAARWYRRGVRRSAAVAGAFAAAFAVQMVFGVSMPLHTPFFWLALAFIDRKGG